MTITMRKRMSKIFIFAMLVMVIVMVIVKTVSPVYATNGGAGQAGPGATPGGAGTGAGQAGPGATPGGAGTGAAQGEKKCPKGQYCLSVPIPTGKETITTIPEGAEGIAKYIKTIYQFSLGIGALLAVAMIVFGGIEYTVSAGNVSRQGEAKDRILNAIYGLALLMAAILILYTIDPRLVGLRLAELPQAEFAPYGGAERAIYTKQENITAGIKESEKEEKQYRKKAVEGENGAKELENQGNLCEAAKTRVKKVAENLVAAEKEAVYQRTEKIKFEKLDEGSLSLAVNSFQGNFERQDFIFLEEDEGKKFFLCVAGGNLGDRLPAEVLTSVERFRQHAVISCRGNMEFYDDANDTEKSLIDGLMVGMRGLYENRLAIDKATLALEEAQKKLTSAKAALEEAKQNVLDKCPKEEQKK